MTGLTEIRSALSAHFAELSERYADRIPSWEVTNENLFLYNYHPSVVNTPHFCQNDTVEWDFYTADRFFPKNRLIINESGDNIWPVFNGNRSAYYMLIERALNKGCRIDSIGMQFHVAEPEEREAAVGSVMYSPERIYSVLDRYADFSLPIQITEISVPSYRRTDEDEEIQAEILKNLYSIWFSHPCMEAIVCWDTVDGLDWRPYRLGWIREDLTPKKAYTTIRDLFGKTWRTNAELASDAAGHASFRAFYGDYEVMVCGNGKSVTKDLRFLKKGPRDFEIIL